MTRYAVTFATKRNAYLTKIIQVPTSTVNVRGYIDQVLASSTVTYKSLVQVLKLEA